MSILTGKCVTTKRYANGITGLTRTARTVSWYWSSLPGRIPPQAGSEPSVTCQTEVRRRTAASSAGSVPERVKTPCRIATCSGATNTGQPSLRTDYTRTDVTEISTGDRPLPCTVP